MKHHVCLHFQESETLELQNHNLKVEINKLETEKKRLMEILNVHEPGCLKRLRQEVPSRSASGGAEFRVPPAPIRPGASSSGSTHPPNVQNEAFSTGSYQDTSSSFADEEATVEYVEDIKPPPQIQVNSFSVNDDKNNFMRNSCSLDNVDSSSAAAFLGKRPLGHTYLDLDSRCIAL